MVIVQPVDLGTLLRYSSRAIPSASSSSPTISRMCRKRVLRYRHDWPGFIGSKRYGRVQPLALPSVGRGSITHVVETRNKKPLLRWHSRLCEGRESQLLNASCVCTQDSFGIRLWAAAHFYHLALSCFSTNLNSHFASVAAYSRSASPPRHPANANAIKFQWARRPSTSPPKLGIPRSDSDE